MNRSPKLAAWCITVFVGSSVSAGSAVAAHTERSERAAPASSYGYALNTREELALRRSTFDPSDGLQRWERLLLAMDPNGPANGGR